MIGAVRSAAKTGPGVMAWLAGAVVLVALLLAAIAVSVFRALLWAIGIVIYFAPVIVAWQRNVARQRGIFVLTLLLGWTLIGWVGALVWALVEPRRTDA